MAASPKCRSIPACAGEPSSIVGFGSGDRVYPRVCGGTRRDAGRHLGLHGLSPRVRGNLPKSYPIVINRRSIPACAGEPLATTYWSKSGTVYPRVCGGTRRSQSRCSRISGLSPRVRGNRSVVTLLSRLMRSIPACAGEPGAVGTKSYINQVYPRVCGGTVNERAIAGDDKGLSPRVRGNRRPDASLMRCWRSIPACAGEPR